MEMQGRQFNHNVLGSHGLWYCSAFRQKISPTAEKVKANNLLHIQTEPQDTLVKPQ